MADTETLCGALRWWLGWTMPRAIASYFDGIARRTNRHPRCSVCGRKS